MSTLTIILIIVAVVVVAVAVIVGVMVARRRALRRQFGPEYDRTVASAGSRREAEVDLRERMHERRALDIRPLPDDAQGQYREEWRAVQSQFVDAPSTALGQADALIGRVMVQRGYPVDDFERQADLVSVDHPTVVHNYREAHGIYSAAVKGEATTEDMRRGFVCYRALFDELVGAGGTVESEEGAAR